MEFTSDSLRPNGWSTASQMKFDPWVRKKSVDELNTGDHSIEGFAINTDFGFRSDSDHVEETFTGKYCGVDRHDLRLASGTFSDEHGCQRINTTHHHRR